MKLKDIVIDVEKSAVKFIDQTFPTKIKAIEARIYQTFADEIKELKARIKALEADRDGKTKVTRTAKKGV